MYLLNQIQSVTIYLLTKINYGRWFSMLTLTFSGKFLQFFHKRQPFSLFSRKKSLLWHMEISEALLSLPSCLRLWVNSKSNPEKLSWRQIQIDQSEAPHAMQLWRMTWTLKQLFRLMKIEECGRIWRNFRLKKCAKHGKKTAERDETSKIYCSITKQWNSNLNTEKLSEFHFQLTMSTS